MFLNCFCLYLRRYNVRVKADVGLNRSSVSVVSRPHLEIQHRFIFHHHCMIKIKTNGFTLL